MASSSRSRSRFGAVPSRVASRRRSRATGPRQRALEPAAGDCSSSRSRLACLNQVTCWRAFASSSSWAAARSRGSYLAEEVSLGRRPVAIKVSRPDGNEPQILARLQHTHIVPVHSVCDDPESGLRVLCMPYFGGANLAQVLEASGGLIPTHHDGRSLVKALDQVSRGFTSQSSRGACADRASAVASGPGDQTRPHRPAPPCIPSSTRNESQAASRFRSLLTRWVGPRAVTTARLEEHEADHGQPSRQFLHGASAIQAAVWIVARLADGLEHAHSRGSAPSRPEALEYPAGRRRNAHAP